MKLHDSKNNKGEAVHFILQWLFPPHKLNKNYYISLLRQFLLLAPIQHQTFLSQPFEPF